MKILFVTARFPYPLLRGDQLIQFNRLRVLSKNHEITLLSFYENDDELDGLEFIKPFCKEIVTVKQTRVKSFIMMLKNIFSSKPFQVAYYESKTFDKYLSNLVKNNSFDVIHVFMLRIAPFFLKIKHPKIIELIDSMTLNFSRRVDQSVGLKKIVLKEELRRLVIYENMVSQFFDEVVVVAEADRLKIKGSNVINIPNGIDLETFFPSLPKENSSIVIFSGNMTYSPNIEAIKWFIENCWSEISAAFPNVECWIVGSNPGASILSLAQYPNVKVTGQVFSMADVIRKSAISIAPMQSGSGIQNKILEAMACGVPVVTTSLGLGSIKAKSGEEIVVVDVPRDFVKAVVSLLENPTKRYNIGNSGYQFVKHNHTWENGANTIEELYESAIVKSGRSTQVFKEFNL